MKKQASKASEKLQAAFLSGVMAEAIAMGSDVTSFGGPFPTLASYLVTAAILDVPAEVFSEDRGGAAFSESELVYHWVGDFIRWKRALFFDRAAEASGKVEKPYWLKKHTEGK